jgi:hypothetical protein
VTLRVVSNSTPLIALARIRRFELLRELFGEINIPLAAYDEVVNAGKGRAGVIEVESADWIHYHQVSNGDLVAFLRISLDAGEAHWLRKSAPIWCCWMIATAVISPSPLELRLRGRSVSCCVTITVILRILKTPLMNYWHKGSD